LVGGSQKILNFGVCHQVITPHWIFLSAHYSSSTTNTSLFEVPTMMLQNQGRSKRTFLILLLGALALASAKNAARTPATFLPRGITDVAAQNVKLSNIEQTRTHASAAALKSGNGDLVLGGAVPTPTAAELKGTAIFLILDHFFRVVFKKNGISFPSQLGGCCILFAVMIASEIVKPGAGDAVFQYLSPGAGLLARWIAVFFVPGLAMLPNAPSMGNAFEVSTFM
jgi:hypothetical protein